MIVLYGKPYLREGTLQYNAKYTRYIDALC